MVVASLQPEVDNVVTWSDKAILSLSSSKCEIAYFSLDCAEATCQPNITINWKRMLGNTFPNFMDVRYVWQLTFGEHMLKLCQSMSSCIKLWEARPWDGTLWTVVRSASRLWVACLNMQLHLGTMAVRYHHLQTCASSFGGSQSHHQPGTLHSSWCSPRGIQAAPYINTFPNHLPP